MKRKKILLLNPPGRMVYERDYYCSKVSKDNFTYHPVDLLYLSGAISAEHDVDVIDCMAHRTRADACREKITELSPDAVIFLTGHVSWREDIEFLRPLREKRGFPIIGTGDVLLGGSGGKLHEEKALDAIILDFTTDDTLHYLRGDYDRIRYMHYRAGGEVSTCTLPRQTGVEISIPLPRFDKFPMEKYRFSLARRLPLGTVLTDYGCPFKCGFCVMGGVGYKIRSVDNVIEELDCLGEMGVRDIFFIDQTFGAKWGRTAGLLREMIERRYNFGFVCLTRADMMEKDRIGLMKEAGCHTVIMGVETAGDRSLERQAKGTSIEKIKRGFYLAKKAGLRTAGTYIIGLPGEGMRDCMDTLNLALELNTDFASFNIPAPRENTGLRREALDRGWIGDDIDAMDQSGTMPSMRNDALTQQEIMKFRDYAAGRYYRRPAYILKRLAGVRTLYELKTLIIVGLNVLRSLSPFTRR